MDTRIAILFCFVILFVLRYAAFRILGKKSTFLIVSFLVFWLPFTINILQIPPYPELKSGAFNQSFSLEPFVLFNAILLLYLLFSKTKFPFSRKDGLLVLIIVLFFFPSLINGANVDVKYTVFFLIRILNLTLFYVLLRSCFEKETIFRGVYDALSILVICQFFLALLFPVLGIESATEWFLPGSSKWAVGGRGGRFSAIGIFSHPGNLALFCLISFSFFYSAFLLKVKRRDSIVFLVLSVLTLLLTLSRSGVLGFLFSFSVILYIFKNPNSSLFSLKRIIYISVIGAIVFAVIYLFTPIGEYFQGDNFDEMAKARLVHWFAGFEIIRLHPFFGVGLNTHISYFAAELPILDGFFARSPIHNIHIIMLAETGIIGFACLFLLFSKVFKRSALMVNKEVSVNKKVLNLAFSGVLIAFIIYGNLGWSPFANEQISIVYLLYYFSSRI